MVKRQHQGFTVYSIKGDLFRIVQSGKYKYHIEIRVIQEKKRFLNKPLISIKWVRITKKFNVIRYLWGEIVSDDCYYGSFPETVKALEEYEKYPIIL